MSAGWIKVYILLILAAPGLGLHVFGEQQAKRLDATSRGQDHDLPTARCWKPFADGSAEPSAAMTLKASEKSPTSSGPSEKVEIAIYYEALCPSCRFVINTSIAQLWHDTEFKSRIELKLYPYGNTMMIPKGEVSRGYRFWHREYQQEEFRYVFSCQHGQEECFGNLIQACVMKKHPADKYIPFIICMESYDEAASMEKSSFDCAEQQSIPMEPIRECVEGPEGQQAMLAVASATDNAAHTYVPWLTLNGAHSEQAEQDADPAAHGNVLRAVCQMLTAPKPHLCGGTNSANGGASSIFGR